MKTSQELIVLDTEEMVDVSVRERVERIEWNGEEQFNLYVEEQLVNQNSSNKYADVKRLLSLL